MIILIWYFSIGFVAGLISLACSFREFYNRNGGYIKGEDFFSEELIFSFVFPFFVWWVVILIFILMGVSELFKYMKKSLKGKKFFDRREEFQRKARLKEIFKKLESGQCAEEILDEMKKSFDK